MDIEHILRDLRELKEWKAKAEDRIAALERGSPLPVLDHRGAFHGPVTLDGQFHPGQPLKP